MIAKYKSYLYIFSRGRVAAISKATGEIAWETKLKQYVSNINMTFGSIVQEDDKLYIGAGGCLVCLSANDGSFIWKNELKGWGYGFISMESNAAIAAAATAAKQRAAVAGSSPAN